MILISYSSACEKYLGKVVKKLLKEDYFSFEEAAIKYFKDLRYFLEKNITIKTKKSDPIYFSKFGKNLQYITYKRNKRTTWYIFFQQKDNKFLVKYITNNHNPKIALRNL